MKPNKIFNILDLAERARKKNLKFAPCFVGAPGLGKSEIVQSWAVSKGYNILDIRLALKEAPDMIGFPSIHTTSDGRNVTTHNLPDFWPTESNAKTVIILEEFNRATTAVTNCIMQLMTDRKVGEFYQLPDETLVVACINPETTDYDVNSMDPALRDRFEFFNVEYDKKSIVDFAKKSNWDKAVISFVETGAWKYVSPEDLGNDKGAKYISPRTLSKLNAARVAGVNETDEVEVYDSVLGTNYGKTFFSFLKNEQPVSFNDLLERKEFALNKLKAFCSPDNYKMGHISITCREIVENHKELTLTLLKDVLITIGSDQGYALLLELERESKDSTWTTRIFKEFPEVKKLLRSNLMNK